MTAFTSNEKQVLVSLAIAQEGNGNDFGFTDAAFRNTEGISPESFAATFGSLIKKGAFEWIDNNAKVNGKKIGSTQYQLIESLWSYSVPAEPESCYCCGGDINLGEDVWMELRISTGEWRMPDRDEESWGDDSQGCFPFHKDCAGRELAFGRLRVDARRVISQQQRELEVLLAVSPGDLREYAKNIAMIRLCKSILRDQYRGLIRLFLQNQFGAGTPEQAVHFSAEIEARKLVQSELYDNCRDILKECKQDAFNGIGRNDVFVLAVDLK